LEARKQEDQKELNDKEVKKKKKQDEEETKRKAEETVEQIRLETEE
jgi:hypothetical protein